MSLLLGFIALTGQALRGFQADGTRLMSMWRLHISAKPFATAAAFTILAGVSVAAHGFAWAQGSEHGKTMPAPQPELTPQPQQQPATNPLGAGAGPHWETKAQPAPGDAQNLQEADAVATVKAINDYFNKNTSMQGTFVQTDPDNTQKTGKFYFERPGKVRFDYNRTKQKIISDGKYLAIEDHDLKTSDRYPLESTPFRLLLQPEVDFLRDARIISLDRGPEAVVLTVEDKADAAGQIRLFFNPQTMQLKDWIITDAQGLTTKIELNNMELNKTVSADLFKFSDISLPNFKN
jgi:outer membrane lipoprotein-sorting protein